MARMPGTLRAKGAPTRSEQQRAWWQSSDEHRGSAHERGYDRHWSKTRSGYLARHPLCCCHEANGFIVAATILDHIRPHRGDKALFWDRGNWQGLCRECHLRIKSVLERMFDAGRIGAGDLVMSRRMCDWFPIAGPMLASGAGVG